MLSKSYHLDSYMEEISNCLSNQVFIEVFIL